MGVVATRKDLYPVPDPKDKATICPDCNMMVAPNMMPRHKRRECE